MEKDVNKLRIIVVEYTDGTRVEEKVVKEKEKELIAKKDERQQISQENSEYRAEEYCGA